MYSASGALGVRQQISIVIAPAVRPRGFHSASGQHRPWVTSPRSDVSWSPSRRAVVFEVGEVSERRRCDYHATNVSRIALCLLID